MIERTIRIPIPAEIAGEVAEYSIKGNFIGVYIQKQIFEQLFTKMMQAGILELNGESEIDVELIADPRIKNDESPRVLTLITKVKDDQNEFTIEWNQEQFVIIPTYNKNN